MAFFSINFCLFIYQPNLKQTKNLGFLSLTFPPSIKPKTPNTIKPIKTILKTKSEIMDIETFIDLAQHPDKNILVVGEAVSRNQGWAEGALESVKAVLNKEWIKL